MVLELFIEKGNNHKCYLIVTKFWDDYHKYLKISNNFDLSTVLKIIHKK